MSNNDRLEKLGIPSRILNDSEALECALGEKLEKLRTNLQDPKKRAELMENDKKIEKLLDGDAP